jgi:hypothetical protein
MATGSYQLAKDDALAAWQPKPRVQSRWLDTFVNYMVLGTHGFTYAKLALHSAKLAAFRILV